MVACRAKGKDKLIIEVWDTGVGIAKDKIDDVFREFKQLDNPERDSRKGFGLGLSIAQGLAKTIDSEITVNSRQNIGSVFRFELKRSTEDLIDDLPVEQQTFSFDNNSVIVIDDDKNVREAMQQLLQSWGCICFTGEDALQALSAITASGIEADQIDLALVDYRLRNGATGKEAIEILRSRLYASLPAIIITGDTAANRIAEARSADALLIHKPASAQQLRTMMYKLLRNNLHSNT